MDIDRDIVVKDGKWYRYRYRYKCKYRKRYTSGQIYIYISGPTDIGIDTDDW